MAFGPLPFLMSSITSSVGGVPPSGTSISGFSPALPVTFTPDSPDGAAGVSVGASVGASVAVGVAAVSSSEEDESSPQAAKASVASRSGRIRSLLARMAVGKGSRRDRDATGRAHAGGTAAAGGAGRSGAEPTSGAERNRSRGSIVVRQRGH